MVTGLGTELVIAGKLLAPHAGRAAAALAKKVTYRWRIDRQVKRLVKTRYPRRHFRAWLKTISEADLAEPIEFAGARLAVSLDTWLESHHEDWRTRADRLSQALGLVEAIYLAILKVADPALGRQLSEQWSRRRNDEVVSRMVDLAGGHAPVSPEDLAVWLRRRSIERRRVRLSVFDIDPAVLDPAISAIRGFVPEVSPGSFRALVGSFGAGKSEIAEEWHSVSIDRFLADSGGRVPSWVHARDVASGGIEQALAQQVGASRLRERGVALVIDGLDEVDGATAEAIARDSRVLVAGDQRSKLVIVVGRSLPLTSGRYKADDVHNEGHIQFRPRSPQGHRRAPRASRPAGSNGTESHAERTTRHGPSRRPARSDPLLALDSGGDCYVDAYTACVTGLTLGKRLVTAGVREPPFA